MAERKVKTDKNDIGMVLCGGGAKGAFQIGAWKALEKAQIVQKIKAVSGTSVGALNAVLFALGDYELAKNIWLSIDKTILLSKNKDGDALFSREGLIKILDSLPLQNLKSKIPVWVTAYNCDNKCTDYYCINNMPLPEMKKLLIATSAMPHAYDPVAFNSCRYRDGGITELGNTPVVPLYNEGFKGIVIVALDEKFNQYKINANPHPLLLKYNENSIDRSFHDYINLEQRYPDTEYKIIKPLNEMGGLVKGVLNFKNTYVVDKIIEGFIATRFILEVEMKNKYSEANIRIQHLIKEMIHSAEEYEKFLQVTNCSNLNIQFKTMGGTVCWTDIDQSYGWRLQQLGKTEHYRIIDNNNERRAWFTDPDDLLHALQAYEAAKETGLV